MGRGPPRTGDRESAEQNQPRVQIFYRHRSVLGKTNRPFGLRSWHRATLIDRYGGVKKKVRLGTQGSREEEFFSAVDPTPQRSRSSLSASMQNDFSGAK